MNGISDDGAGAPDFTIVEGWIMSFENYRLAQEAGFQRMEALWLIACLIKGVPMPDWMIEKLEGEPDV